MNASADDGSFARYNGMLKSKGLRTELGNQLARAGSYRIEKAIKAGNVSQSFHRYRQRPVDDLQRVQDTR